MKILKIKLFQFNQIDILGKNIIIYSIKKNILCL
jgi:hypothetical protein